jgi:hypothetical protein
MWFSLKRKPHFPRTGLWHEAETTRANIKNQYFVNLFHYGEIVEETPFFSLWMRWPPA